MSSYFLGYVEIRREKDSDWELYRFPDKENSPEGAAYVRQGYVRDCLSNGNIGEHVRSKVDPTYKPKEYDSADPNSHPLFRRDKRYLVDEPMSATLEEMINKEWDPDNEDSWGTRNWKIVTLESIYDRAEKDFNDHLGYLKESYVKENKSKIFKRLDRIEDAVNRLTARSEDKPVGIYTNLGIADVVKEDDEDDEWGRWDVQAREEAIECLNYDVGSLNELYGFLYGIKDTCDFADIRFIAAID